MRFVFDSDLNRQIKNMPCSYPINSKNLTVPATIIRKFRVEAKNESGQWNTVLSIDNNYQRLVNIKTDITTFAARFIPEETWGSEKAHLFAWDVK